MFIIYWYLINQIFTLIIFVRSPFVCKKGNDSHSEYDFRMSSVLSCLWHPYGICVRVVFDIWMRLNLGVRAWPHEDQVRLHGIRHCTTWRRQVEQRTILWETFCSNTGYYHVFHPCFMLHFQRNTILIEKVSYLSIKYCTTFLDGLRISARKFRTTKKNKY